MKELKKNKNQQKKNFFYYEYVKTMTLDSFFFNLKNILFLSQSPKAIE